MLRLMLPAALAFLSGCAAMGGNGGAGADIAAGAQAQSNQAQANSVASGAIRLADGRQVGAASVYRATDGNLTLRVALAGAASGLYAPFPPGTYGMHIHSVGRCDGPGFTTAGPHWNPSQRQHGRLNAMGTHHGDLPNLIVPEDGVVLERFVLPGPASGEIGLLDADGASFIIHAAADDERTDPSGNSGARIACAVLTPD